WITNPASHTPVSKAYHILNGAVSLSSLICIIDTQDYNQFLRPHSKNCQRSIFSMNLETELMDFIGVYTK
ncbi:MAG TPA: hypothetical protein DCY12_02270, partial [Candidatus Atribacteria bacterium]|nr:hypothetical protein [Candidatus Atribacteria bacterium]